MKRVAYSLLSLAAALRRRRELPAGAVSGRNVLVVQLGLIGDVLLVTPMLALMRATLPQGSRITLVVPPGSVAAVQDNPHVDRVVAYDAFWADPADEHRHVLRLRHLVSSWRFIRSSRHAAYDLVINCWMMDQPLTPFLLSFLNTGAVAGFRFRYSGAFTDVTQLLDPERHLSDSLIDLYQRVANVAAPPAPSALHFRLPDALRDRDAGSVLDGLAAPYLVIAPFASESAKEWSLAHWATVLSDVRREHPDVTVVLTGLAQARARSERLAASVAGGVRNAVGELTFPQFAVVLRHADGLLSTDSGAVHLASALGVPVFVLYSQIYNYRHVLPYGVTSDYSVVPVPCAGCIHGCAAVSCMQHDVFAVRDQVRRFCMGLPHTRSRGA